MKSFTLPLLALLTACASAPPADVPRAKNVILFIGDGMGVATVTAARIFDGQSRGLPGEEHLLAFERFPNVALVKTYNSNQQVPDSAGTATAMLTGQKTRAGVINVAREARRRHCAEALANPLPSLGEIAKRRGLAVGVVTTARLTHATPATVYAHTPERDWESDRFMTEADLELGCRDIARQFVDFDAGGGIDVALGGGRRAFYGAAAGGERRSADDDLVGDWLRAAEGRRFVSTAAELAAARPGAALLGLFAASHMTYVAQRGAATSEPDLPTMTARAIELLSASGDGYFLMVEGGRIDHGHHDGKPGYAMLEAQAFAAAVQAALDRVDPADTLILVTADHSHVMTMSGYPTRGNPILGLVVGNDKAGEPNEAPTIAADGQPYTTLGYMNGPGAVGELPRPRPRIGTHELYQALIPFANNNIDGSVSNDETHGGEDVALYATGPGAGAVRGVIEQDRIFDVMVAAFGWELEGRR